MNEVKLRRVSLLLAFVVTGGIAASLDAACVSDGDVGAGGTCFLVTDCKEGLFCLRPAGSDNGTCSGKAGLESIEPVSDATLDHADVEAKPVPEADATPDEMDTVPDSATSPDTATSVPPDAEVKQDATAQRDGPTPDQAAPPADTGTPPTDSSTPDDTSPADTGSPDSAPTSDG